MKNTETPNSMIVWLDPKTIAESKLNPRTHFDREKIDELVQSFKTHGFSASLSHLLVRKHKEADAGADYELICGARRWKAAMEIGLDRVPAVVDDIGDALVLELQLIENLQREGLTPLEEANAFRAMLALRDADDNAVYTVKTLAAKIGRTEMHVSDRLALCRLEGSPAGVALNAGKLPVTHARLLARLADGETRNELLDRVLDNGGALMSSRQLERIIKEECTVELRGADFDLTDANLVPMMNSLHTGERVSGGACSDCPMNTKNQDASGGSKLHMCTNPECFREKKAAVFDAWAKSVTEEGRTPLSAKAAEKVFDYSGKELSWNSGYVELNDSPRAEELRTGVKDAPSWRKLIRGRGVPVVLAKDVDGKVHELADHKLALMAARENEEGKPSAEKVFKSAQKEVAKSEDDRKAAAIEERKAREKAQRIECAQISAIAESASSAKTTEGFWLLAISALIVAAEGYYGLEPVMERRGLTSGSGNAAALLKYAGTLTGSQQVGLAVELMLEIYDPGDRGAILPKWAKLFLVDLKSVKKQVELAIAMENKAAAEKEQIANGIAWKSKKEKAEDFEWSTDGIAKNPDEAAVELPRDAKLVASVEVARTEKGWVCGFNVQAGKWGVGDPCRMTTNKYSNRELALRTGLLHIADKMKANGASGSALARIGEYVSAIAKPPEDVSEHEKRWAKQKTAKASKKGGAK